MKKQSFDEIPASVRAIIPFAEWFEKHPVLVNVILTIEALALAWVVFNYDFTTTF